MGLQSPRDGGQSVPLSWWGGVHNCLGTAGSQCRRLVGMGLQRLGTGRRRCRKVRGEGSVIASGRAGLGALALVGRGLQSSRDGRDSVP